MEIVHGMVQTQSWKMGGVILTVKNGLVSEYNSSIIISLPATIQHQ